MLLLRHFTDELLNNCKNGINDYAATRKDGIFAIEQMVYQTT